MADDQIPTEALEAAARAIAALNGEDWLFNGRYPQYEERRRRYRGYVREAAPHLIAEGRRQAAREIVNADQGDDPSAAYFLALRIAEGGNQWRCPG